MPAKADNGRDVKRAMECARGGHAVRALYGGLAIALLLGLSAGRCGHAQSQQGPTSGMSGGQTSVRGTFGHPDMSSLSSDGDYDPVMMERRMQALNMERQKEMVNDTNKLLKLARELNDEVASTKSDTFTSDQLRKIAEIEKLARSVRDRMTAGTAVAPSLLSTPPIVFPSH